jgi:hypothetical protein
VKRHQARLDMADAAQHPRVAHRIPSSNEAVGQLYQSSEKFIRFLMSELRKDRIVAFIDRHPRRKKMPVAVLEVLRRPN